jgi:hypothetical protein
MTKQEKEDLKTVLNYLWRDEQKHYQANPCKNHIYSVLRRLAQRIGYKETKCHSRRKPKK